MAATCSIEDCGKKVTARGWCSAHYTRWKRHGDPLTPLRRQPQSGPCAAEGCDVPARKTGLCARHYTRARMNGGDPNAPHRAATWTEPGAPCVVCGSTDKEKPRSNYCSSACSTTHSRWGGDVPHTATCNLCGCDVRLTRPGQRRKRSDSLLCDRCVRRRSLRHKQSVNVVGDKCNWLCGICGETVDRGLDYPDLMSPSVDHILPRSRGGSDDLENLQISHLTCNHRKSNAVGPAWEGGTPWQ